MAAAFETQETICCPGWNMIDDSSIGGGSLHCIDPLRDERWDEFVQQHPRSSVFHTSAWLEALRQTYGYEPVAYTTAPPTASLDNAVVFCRIESWLTGRRLISLPFSDHCEPLFGSDLTPEMVAKIVTVELAQNDWSYVELRPLGTGLNCDCCSKSDIGYAFHELDLTLGPDVLFRKFHKSSTQRKIRRAERERLSYCEGSDDALLNDFYSLFELTRRRHGIPPQPREWFNILRRRFGAALKIRMAYRNHQALAGMITIRHRKTLVYKYGCSDSQFNNLGSMHFLFWRAIQEAQSEGLESLDLGRTNVDQQGLITFKNRWGARQRHLTYSRFSSHISATHFLDLSTGNLKARVAKSLVSHLPLRIVSRIGQILYGHVG